MVLADISIFIGRFHPLIVHLPIGILFLAFVLNVIFIKKSDHPLYKSISLIILIGAIFSIPAAGAGLLLAESGGYGDDELSLHQYFGIGLIILSFGVWYFRRRTQNVNLHLSMVSTLIVVLMITGHLGGNLTHGSNYLIDYAPSPIKSFLANNSETDSNRDFSSIDIDSLVIFNHLIAPIFQAKCISCHQDSKTQGGLNLTSIEGIKKGGDSGQLLAEGDPYNSLLFHRVTLDRRNSKFMPPKGEPLTFNEIKLIEWWIDNGASLEKNINDFEVNEGLKKAAKELYLIDLNPVPFIEKIKVPTLVETKLNEIRSKGFRVNTLSGNSNLLDIAFIGQRPITREQLKALSEVKENVVWLDLSGSDLQDGLLEGIGEMNNLVRLRLDNNPLTDKGVTHVAKLTNLESLSLYNTQVGDPSIDTFKAMPALKSIYVWQTHVSDASIESLKSSNPKMELVRGFSF